MAGDKAGALAHVDDASLLDRIEAGENPARIAESLGVHKSAIYHRFAGRPEYKAARKNGMSVRVEDAQDKIGDATDTFTLAQAREMFKAIAWRAEREFPDDWGNRPTASINIDLGSALQLLSERIQAKTVAPDAAPVASITHDAAQQVD